ncbi:biotin--[acetyl-CoA-carboxylase] ligase [Cryobacterium melibiosiphilum]|uniref:biotin--[biotin carboxyl-carrier protein] ligase n=1 Tax=Cryobacterium melibiosiphilum TaxID=995039 RepID=A0A3A5MEA1_9MICO|nr:biotin--[acetyl-CoA-carboxylase] ligase [Cryobacterium melibiosiphilum]RJT87782.1 biotin--[acetyl-CoA-carboxylase] ligase [Cryobacterium melibiosiphilum]
MEFALSRALVHRNAARFEYLAEAGSTNTVLVGYAAGSAAPATDAPAGTAAPLAAAWPELSVVVTDNQTRGRGRLGRTWMAPTGKSLAISVLLRPATAARAALPPERLGWFPLLAGAAMTRAVRALVQASEVPVTDQREPENPAHEVTLKWPNDVLIDGYKVSGILSELLPSSGGPSGGSTGSGIVIGAGLNVSLDEHDLPTLTSTSLLLVTGTDPNPDAVLAAYLTELFTLYRDFLAADADPLTSGLLAEVTRLCGTIGSVVRVELPGGADLIGTATGIDELGRLIVADQVDGEPIAVSAGDVTHLRY